jgi:hypothetical protein
MLNLNSRGVEVFIKRHKSKTQHSFWNNFELIIWKKDQGGYTNKNGMFRNDSWGTAEKIAVNNQGIWKLPKKYVKYFK